MINRKLAVPLLVLVFFMILFSYGQNRKMQATFLDNRQKIGDINSSLQDTLAGIRVVQSFANEEIERKKFKHSNHNFLVSKDANYHCMGTFMSGNLFFQGLSICHIGFWWIFDRKRADGSSGSCNVCTLYRYLYQSDPGTGGIMRKDAKKGCRDFVVFWQLLRQSRTLWTKKMQSH